MINAVEMIKEALGSIEVEPKQELIQGDLIVEKDAMEKKEFKLTIVPLNKDGAIVEEADLGSEFMGVVTQKLSFRDRSNPHNPIDYEPSVSVSRLNPDVLVVPVQSVYSDISVILEKYFGSKVLATPENIGCGLKVIHLRDDTGEYLMTSSNQPIIDASKVEQDGYVKAILKSVPFTASELARQMGYNNVKCLVLCINESKYLKKEE